MVKILKEGILPGDKVYKSTCRHCDTVFEFQAKEANLVGDQRDGNYYSINCPLCENICTVSQSPKPVFRDPMDR